MARDKKSYNEGAAAFRAGKFEDSNPYPQGKDKTNGKRQSWFDGFYDERFSSKYPHLNLKDDKQCQQGR